MLAFNTAVSLLMLMLCSEKTTGQNEHFSLTCTVTDLSVCHLSPHCMVGNVVTISVQNSLWCFKHIQTSGASGSGPHVEPGLRFSLLINLLINLVTVATNENDILYPVREVLSVETLHLKFYFQTQNLF